MRESILFCRCYYLTKALIIISLIVHVGSLIQKQQQQQQQHYACQHPIVNSPTIDMIRYHTQDHAIESIENSMTNARCPFEWIENCIFACSACMCMCLEHFYAAAIYRGWIWLTLTLKLTHTFCICENILWSNKLFGNRLNELIFMHLVDVAHILPHKLNGQKFANRANEWINER